jgi:hypothetical protein
MTGERGLPPEAASHDFFIIFLCGQVRMIMIRKREEKNGGGAGTHIFRLTH